MAFLTTEQLLLRKHLTSWRSFNVYFMDQDTIFYANQVTKIELLNVTHQNLKNNRNLCGNTEQTKTNDLLETCQSTTLLIYASSIAPFRRNKSGHLEQSLHVDSY